MKYGEFAGALSHSIQCIHTYHTTLHGTEELIQTLSNMDETSLSLEAVQVLLDAFLASKYPNMFLSSSLKLKSQMYRVNFSVRGIARRTGHPGAVTSRSPLFEGTIVRRFGETAILQLGQNIFGILQITTRTQ